MTLCTYFKIFHQVVSSASVHISQKLSLVHSGLEQKWEPNGDRRFGLNSLQKRCQFELICFSSEMVDVFLGNLLTSMGKLML